jgi:DNA-binding PadR family transcriptional regulator
MEQKRWIRAEWGLSESKRKAKFYELTALGRRELAAHVDSWRRFTGAVSQVLGTNAHAVREA